MSDNDNKPKMAAAVGAATMDDAEMERISNEAKKAAESRAKGDAVGNKPTRRVSVLCARPHFRAGMYWTNEGPCEADVTAEQFALLKGDRELVVTVTEPEKKR